MAVRTLLLFRHADAVRPLGTPDIDRDLSAHGEDQARHAGRWLAEQGLVPGLAVVSPSVRTDRTWALTAEELTATAGGPAPAVTVARAVYHAGMAELVGVVHEVPDAVTTALICGHEPGLSEIALWLAGPESDTAAHARIVRGIKKGAVAVLTAQPAPDGRPWSWSDVGPDSFTLRQVWAPAP